MHGILIGTAPQRWLRVPVHPHQTRPPIRVRQRCGMVCFFVVVFPKGIPFWFEDVRRDSRSLPFWGGGGPLFVVVRFVGRLVNFVGVPEPS